MNDKQHSLEKLLPKKTQVADAERDTSSSAPARSVLFINGAIGLVAMLLLSFLLLPRIPLLEEGEISPRDIVAPYTFYIEYPGPEQTVVSSRVERGEIIVESGRRVNERAAQIIAEIARREGVGSKLDAYLGLCILTLLILYLFYRDIRRYRPALIGDTKRLSLFIILLLLTVAISQFARQVLLMIAGNFQIDPATVGFVLPVAAGAMLTSLLLDFHLTLNFSFLISILLGVIFHADPLLPIFYFQGSIVAGLAVIHFKKRTAIVRAGALVALTNMLTVAGIDLYHGELLTRGWHDMGASMFGALVASMIVSISLPFFESLFDIATNIKLLELLDPNQPLLKKLVYSSPGTYHHSIVIGNLAEAAAEAINENPLLARVGAYYHDIGKIRKPEYYIENQRAEENKHDKLAPSMSSLIIASHVKEGVELAREHKLPSLVTDIIHQHHGTSLITYFYQKARDLAPLGNIVEEDYRYPGPRPRTKVAAIVMLADSVEASSRTLADPNPQRIQALTNSVITRIFLDDQLSKCDLTLKDLREIARSFNIVLNGIFHQRIDYPGGGFLKDKKRGEHQAKKHPEETKIATGNPQEAARETAAGPRSS